MALQGISRSTSNSLVSYSLSKLSAGDRSLTITSTRIISSVVQYREIDRYISEHLRGLSSDGLTREVLYHEISDVHGTGFYFAGVQDLAHEIRLTSGRFPTQCNPNRCEVVQIGGSRSSKPQADSLGLVIVGVGNFSDSHLFTGTMAPSDTAPILVASGLMESSNLAHFSNLQGVDAWVGNIDLTKIEKVGSDAYIQSILAFSNQLSIDHSEITLTWPQDALAEAGDQAKGISSKFVLLDFTVGALLIAFLVLFSLRHRREHQLFRAGLSRIGTPKKTLAMELFFENSAPLVLGAIAALLASLFLPPVLSIAHFHANLAQIYEGWIKFIFLLLSTLAMAVGAAIFDDHAWRRQRWTPFALGLIFLAAYLRQSGSHELRTWLLPFAYVLIPASLSYLILRIVSAIWRGRRNDTYVLFREHLPMWQGVAAIITLATVLAMVALSFDSGISQSVIKQSQDQIPLDVSLKTGPALIRPLDLGGTREFENLLPGARVYPILRSGTAVRSQSSVSDSLSLIGIPPNAMEHLPIGSLRKFSSLIAPTSSVSESGANIGSSKEISVTLKGIPKEVDMVGWFRTPRGTHMSLTFSGHGDIRTLQLRGQVPAESSLIAFEFRETSDYLSRRLHAMGEGSYAVPMLKGVGSIEDVSFDGYHQSLSKTLWGMNNFSYAFDGGSIFIRPTVRLQIPIVVVDPTTASLATNDLLTLTGTGDRYFQVRVGAITKFFPSAGDRFIIMDLSLLQAEIGQSDLGAIDPIELWVATSNSEKYLNNLRFSSLQGLVVQSRKGVEQELRSDPVNVGLDGSYRASLLFALLIAIFMYASALPLLYREGAKILFQLEASGIGPRRLRRSLRRSLRLTVSIGLLTGTVVGLLVGRFFISPSIPFVIVTLILIAALIMSEIGGFLFTRRFFTEDAMVGV